MWSDPKPRFDPKCRKAISTNNGFHVFWSFPKTRLTQTFMCGPDTLHVQGSSQTLSSSKTPFYNYLGNNLPLLLIVPPGTRGLPRTSQDCSSRSSARHGQPSRAWPAHVQAGCEGSADLRASVAIVPRLSPRVHGRHLSVDGSFLL